MRRVRRTSAVSNFIIIARYLKKVGIDLIKFREERFFVIVGLITLREDY